MQSLAEIIGGNIKRRREEMGLSQKQLTMKLSGYDKQGLVSSWELGKRCPSAAMLEALADVFECSIDALFGREKGE